jgi:uncharacterized protein with FMN-binding domain
MNLVPAGRTLAFFLLLGLLSSCTVDRAALVKRVDLRDVDLRSVPDGVYEGEYTIDPSPAMAANRHVKVRITVAGGKYTNIEILQPPKLGASKTYVTLLSHVKESGSLSADAVSSATVTSVALLKAIQNAVQRTPEVPPAAQ